jgi:hypothetical protein
VSLKIKIIISRQELEVSVMVHILLHHFTKNHAVADLRRLTRDIEVASRAHHITLFLRVGRG